MGFNLDETIENISGLSATEGKALIAWIVGELDIDTLWEHPNAQRPEPPYATLNVITGPNKSTAQDEYEVLSPTSYRLSGQRFFTLSVNIFGDQSKKFMVDLLNSIDNPIVLQDFKAAGLGVWSDGNPNDVSAILETGFEKRAQMDIILGKSFNKTVTAPEGGIAEIVGTEGTWSGAPEGNIIQTDSIDGS